MKKLIYIFTSLLFSAFSFGASAQSTVQTREVSGFNGVASSGPFNVHITMGNKESVKLDIDADLIDKVETVVEDGTLLIRFKKAERFAWKNHNIEKAEIYVSAKSLSAIVNSGSGNIEVTGPINTDNFKAVVSGSGTLKAGYVKATELHANLSGSGSIDVKGSANSINAIISGSGEIKGEEFKTESATVVISGSGNVYLKAEKELKATIIGSGTVYYSGNAQVSSHKIGSGSVTKVD